MGDRCCRHRRRRDHLSDVFGLARRLSEGSCGLAAYLRSALSSAALGPRPQVRELFPMPPPYGWDVGSPPRARRERDQWRLRVATNLLVNLVVVALSHLASGGSRRCPSWARSGAPLSDRQTASVAHLRGLCSSYLDPAAPASDRALRSQQLLERSVSLGRAPLGSLCAPSIASFVADVSGDRATFSKTDADFEPTSYLNTFAAACYLEPRLLEPRSATKPAIASGPQRGSNREFLEFLRQWDVRGRLHLEPPRTTTRFEQGTLFPVPKTLAEDRIVFNRIPRNAREQHLSGYSRFTPAGHDFVEVEVPPGHEVKLYSDDLSDAFPSFRATRARAVTNALAWTAPVEEFNGFRALEHLRRDCLRRGVSMPTRVRPCHKGLVIGDLSAADFCAEAHAKVLRSHWSFPAARAISNGHLFPRGGAIEALVLDDHVGLAIDAVGNNVNSSLIADSFAGAERAYAATGLHANPRKTRRGATSGVALGAEFFLADAGISHTAAEHAASARTSLPERRQQQHEQQQQLPCLGSDGALRSPPLAQWVGAERMRRRLLARAALAAALARRSSRRHLRQLAASFVHAFLYRRPLLAVHSAVFTFVGPVGDEEDLVVSLPGPVVNELLIASLLIPAAATNLAASWSSELLATDASHFAEGMVSTRVPPALMRELWRHRDRRGAYTRLEGRWGELLRQASADHAAIDLEDLPYGASPGPARVLIETFDFIEVCCGQRGSLSAAMAKAGFRVGPRIDLAVHPMWDLKDDRIIEWLIFLIHHHRVWGVHSAVAYSDFSARSRPFVGDHGHPSGHHPCDPQHAEGNFLLGVVCALFIATRVAAFGWMSHEHPATAHSWAISFWSSFVVWDCAAIGRFCGCRFGSLSRKDTRLARLRAPFLQALDQTCICEEPHPAHFEDNHTAAAADYMPGFCEQFACACRSGYDAAPPEFAKKDLELVAKDPDVRGERIWVNELLRSIPWRPRLSRPVPGSTHINVREARVALGCIAHAGRQRFSSRVLAVVDSRVAIGAGGKGRSASRPLNRELRHALPELIGADTYPGFIFGPTRLQPADDGSRLKQQRARRHPDGAPLPSWLDALLGGDVSELDYIASLPLQSRRTACWATLAIKCAARGILRLSPRPAGWDPTLGYPGEGPSHGRALPADRSANLLASTARHPAVLARRARLLAEFRAHVFLQFGVEFDVFLQNPAVEIDRALASWGQICFRAGRSLLDYRELINSAVDYARFPCGSLGHAWDVAWVWRSLIPEGNRMAMPEPVFLALLSVALMWRWDHIALLLSTGFLGLLRVGELQHLTFGCFLTPSRLLLGGHTTYITIGKPKMRRVTARRSYTRIDQPGYTDFVEHMIAFFAADANVFPRSYLQFRSAMRALCDELELPSESRRGGLTWGSLRPGGATWLYRITDNPDLVRFRGRWTSQRMLEIYIQEIGASSWLPALPERTRNRVLHLAAWAPKLLKRACTQTPCSLAPLCG